MTLHIAFDGIDGVGKTTMSKKLLKFLQKKQYKTTLRTQPAHEPILDILNTYYLTNHEIALLMATDRSLTYYGENWEQYDIVIWDRSILSSYAYNTDNNTPATFIKQINRYFPLMDLYIIIQTDEYLQKQDYTHSNPHDLINKYHELSKTYKNTVTIKYRENEQDIMFEEIVKIIFDKLPRCNWCGRLFTPTSHLKKYCDETCKKYSLEEQMRINNRNYYHRYKDVMSERQKGGLGSKGANLHGTADPNPLAELQKVRNAKRSLGL